MNTSMLGLLGVLILILGINASPNLPEMTLNKLAGKWYLLGTVSDAWWRENPTWMEKVSLLTVTPTTDGELRVKSTVRIALSSSKFGCVGVINTLTKTKTPETFLFNGLYFRPITEFTFLDVKYDEYIIIQSKRTMKENVTYKLDLYTRMRVVSQDIKRKFSEVVQKEKFDPDKIIFLPYQGECD